MTDNEQTAGQMQIGALATATGLTVRTLHHYDQVGLLVPDERSQSGRRLYSEQNVRRLYEIVALRRLRLSLDEIVAVLDQSPDLSDVVPRHLARVERTLELQQRLHRTLSRMLELLNQEHAPGLGQFIEAIEVMTMIEKYYTPEQQGQLEQRRDELGEPRIRQAERDWRALIEDVKTEQANGAKPTDPRMRELARRWSELIEQFIGGDEGIRRSLTTMYREEGPKTASHGTVDPELMHYVGQALTALRESD